MDLIGVRGLHNNLDFRGQTQQFGNRVRRADEHIPFQQHHIRGVTLHRRVQILDRFRLGHYPDIVLKGKYLADADPVDRLRIRKNDANGSRAWDGIRNVPLW